jgi:hypothetical protein
MSLDECCVRRCILCGALLPTHELRNRQSLSACGKSKQLLIHPTTSTNTIAVAAVVCATQRGLRRTAPLCTFSPRARRRDSTRGSTLRGVRVSGCPQCRSVPWRVLSVALLCDWRICLSCPLVRNDLLSRCTLHTSCVCVCVCVFRPERGGGWVSCFPTCCRRSLLHGWLTTFWRGLTK